MTTRREAPSSSADLFSDTALANPLPLYGSLRELGPLVWLDVHQAMAVTQFAECRHILRTPEAFTSSAGVALNETCNQMTQGSVLASDGEIHRTLKAVLSKRFSPGAMRELRASVQQRADDLVSRFVDRGSFDAVTDFTQAFPLSVACDFIGFPPEDRHHLLPWATAVFDFFGPPNERCALAEAPTREAFGYAFDPGLPARLIPGSAGAEIFAAVERGELTGPQGCILMMAYVSAALDTTIASLQHLLYLFGTNPAEWTKLRGCLNLIPDAYNEILRLGSPIRAFSRVVTRDCELGGVELRKGLRLLLLFAAANRDPKVWEQPDRFDISRDASAHLSFGHGVHLCAGAPLARLEAHCMLEALARRVARIDVETVTPLANNSVQSLRELRVSLAS
ncbi:MAG TPA: cytochrome P450 [Steroidobacteraceae bacterium]|nr:cytochrome P450 [Steroidobacteraceae bacterium]